MYRTRFSRCSALMLLIVLPLALRDAGAGTRPPERVVEQEAPPPGLSSLPIQAQASISAALGRDQRAYHAKREGRAWRLENPKHGLRADFTTGGVEVRSGAARFGLRLTGLGRGARLEAVAASKPEAKSNRIDYRRGALSEWYVNGPLGLEQGFTLGSPPARKGSEALTLALRLSGDLSAVPDPRGEGMALQGHGAARRCAIEDSSPGTARDARCPPGGKGKAARSDCGWTTRRPAIRSPSTRSSRTPGSPPRTGWRVTCSAALSL
jgi:hypothetical protein